MGSHQDPYLCWFKAAYGGFSPGSTEYTNQQRRHCPIGRIKPTPKWERAIRLNFFMALFDDENTSALHR